MSKARIILLIALLAAISSKTGRRKFLRETIDLPPPLKTGGMPIFQAMKNRHSARDYIDGREFTMEELSQLLWSGYGPNRDDMKKTSASAVAKYPFDVYVFKSDGTYKYLPNENKLEIINNRDFRGMTGTQDFVASASVNIVLVADLDREDDTPDIEKRRKRVELDSGHVIQNMMLWACANEKKCVPRGMFVEEGLKEILQLNPPEKYYIPITASISN